MRRITTKVLTFVLICAAVFIYMDGMDTMEEKSVWEKYGDMDFAKYGIENSTWVALMKAAETDERLIVILEHMEYYSEEMIRLATENAEARDYAAAWWENRDVFTEAGDILLSLEGGVPYFTQWDGRWGYDLYGGSPLGLTGCGPTCLSMAAVYLTGDTGLNPLKIARFSEENGWYVPGSGSSWDLMRSGAEMLGLAWREVPLNEGDMRLALEQGELIICSMLPGDFTSSGHFIVIDGYENGAFTVKDPNSIKNSEKSWSYDELKNQLAVIWAYSAA